MLADEAVLRLVSTEQVVRFAIDGGDRHEFPPGAAIEFSYGDGEAAVLGRVVAVAPEVDSANMLLVEASIDRASTTRPLPSGSQGHVRAAADP